MPAPKNPRAGQAHPVAVADPAQWLRAFAKQFKGETRASLEHCARKLDASPPELLQALNLHLTFLKSLPHGWLGKTCGDIGALNDAYLTGNKALAAIAKAEGRP